FMHVQGYRFVATGGAGYHAIDKYKTYNFGVELLTKLIEPNDPLIKRVSNRRMTGNRLGEHSMYIEGIPIITEKNFNTFINEIYLSLESDIIQERLGVPIQTRKKDFSFLAKDSI